VMKLLGIDPGARVNPSGGLRTATPQGHKAAFASEKCLWVRAAWDVTPGCLDPTKDEFQLMMGARQPWGLQGITQRGRTGQGDRLHGGSPMHQRCGRAALLKVVDNGQSWRLCLLAARFGVQQGRHLVHPTDEPHSLRAGLVDQLESCPPA
jgi:hypothetical protein